MKIAQCFILFTIFLGLPSAALENPQQKTSSPESARKQSAKKIRQAIRKLNQKNNPTPDPDLMKKEDAPLKPRDPEAPDKPSAR